MLKILHRTSPPSPALLPLQQFTVCSDLNVQSHFDIEEVLVFPKVASHLLLQVADLIFQATDIVLVVANLIAKLVLHVTHLPQQSFILKKHNKTHGKYRYTVYKHMTGGVGPHCVLQCINFTAEGLNLPPGLIGLLLGLPQGIRIALCRLGQISKLQGRK